MGKKPRKELIAFKADEFEYIESMLSDKAAKGQIFRRFNADNAFFDAGEPIERRYRLIPKSESHITDEEFFDFQEKGWTYDCGKGDFLLVYTDDPEAEEIELKSEYLRKKSRKLLYSFIAVGIVVAAILGFLIFKMGNDMDTSTEMITIAGSAAAAVLYVLYSFIVISEPLRCANKIDRGGIVHDLPYEDKLLEAQDRHKRTWYIIGGAIVLAAIVLFKMGII